MDRVPNAQIRDEWNDEGGGRKDWQKFSHIERMGNGRIILKEYMWEGVW